MQSIRRHNLLTLNLTHAAASVTAQSYEDHYVIECSFLDATTYLTGNSLDAMEAAKTTIGNKPALDPSLLLEIAVNKKYRLWSRVAAVYSAGLLGFKSGVSDLVELLGATESPTLRSHVAEALGNIGSPAAIDALGSALIRDRSNSVKRSCVYALSQFRTHQSKLILQRAKSKNQKGAIRNEIDRALKRLERVI